MHSNVRRSLAHEFPTICPRLKLIPAETILCHYRCNPSRSFSLFVQDSAETLQANRILPKTVRLFDKSSIMSFGFRFS